MLDQLKCNFCVKIFLSLSNAKVTQGQMKSDRLQGLDVRGDNVTCGDDDKLRSSAGEVWGRHGGVEACANSSCISGMG